MCDRLSLTSVALVGDLEAVELLLDKGAKIDAVDGLWNALHAAIENGHVALVKLLIKRGANIDQSCAGLSPLAHAVDISIDATAQQGESPGDEPTDIIEALIAAGADKQDGL